MRSPCGTREATSTLLWTLPMESPPLPQKDNPKVMNTTKENGGVNPLSKASKNVVEHKPSPNYTCDYVLTLDHNSKMVVKYVGAYTMKAIRKSVWVPKVYASNIEGPKYFWVPTPKA
jgi:hypothetical protein